MAEAAGSKDPQPLQRLLRNAKWEHESLKEWLEQSIYHALEDSESRWDIDDTSFLKQGKNSVGVQRQYCGCVGKTANCQVAVCLAFSSFKGYSVVDFRLYLPKSWVNDSIRCKQAGVPEETVFHTKAQLAIEMLSQALTKGYRASCVTADADYGKSEDLRCFLEAENIAFGMGLKKNMLVYSGSEQEAQTLEAFEKRTSASDWLTIPLPGTQGRSQYSWHFSEVWMKGKKYGLLIRKYGKDSRYFLTWSPRKCDMMYWVRQIAGRWDIERCFQEAKQELGLDEYQVRKWVPWHRHMTLVWAALWFLNRFKLVHSNEKWTLPQLRQLMRIPWLVSEQVLEHLLYWLHWRREHNRKASFSHRKRGSFCFSEDGDDYVTL